VDVAAEALDVVDQLLEIVIEPRERRLLDRAGAVAERVAFGKLAERLAAEIDELGGRDRERLLQEADRALYTSKFSGRAMSTVYDPLTIYEERSSENLAELLSTAIVERRLSVVYQPIFEAASERLMGHETLMRFRDREGRAIGPAVFIPVAEHTGSIVELGAWVIDQACSDMRRHGLGPVVAVNISAIQLKAPNFSLLVAEILGRYEIAPNRLALEFTEGMDIVPDAVALRNIEHLRNLGVQVWLDDFGTGFASLAWLRRFDFDVVKIDRSFLHECHIPQGMRMLQDMVRLLRNQGYKVLVEGIETGEQKVLVPRLGVHAMQGYHLGRPEPVDEPHADGAEQIEAGDRQRNPREQARRANLTY
jgi:EAL domain-containing protein (putative c-di-GMP-specific phosphodiesterase class I)